MSITAADGAPEPLGPSAVKNGVNFAVYSKHATGMKLCLFNESNEAITELDMKRSGDVWHVTATGCPKRGILYGVRVFGKGGWETGERWAPERVLLDPYTPLVSGRRVFGQRDKFEQFEPEVCVAVMLSALSKPQREHTIASLSQLQAQPKFDGPVMRLSVVSAYTVAE